MNDHLFTPALLLVGILTGSLLAWLELLWLKRPFEFAGSWRALILISLINIAFIYLLLASQNSHLFLLFVPVPVFPALYLLLKVLAYYMVGRMTGTPVHGPWKLVLLSLVTHPLVLTLVFGGFEGINPSQRNLEQAIRNRHNRLLEVMLWTSVKFEPNMTILVNEAITVGNDDAVRRLIRRGANPRSHYWIDRANHETQWRLTKWRLDRGLKPEEELHSPYDSPPIEALAVGHGMAELRYCVQKGFDPAKHPKALQAALEEHPLREHGVIQPDEMQVMKDKIAFLLDHGADVNGQGDLRFTPIFTLLNLSLDLSPILTLLIEKGADVNARSPNKMYPHDRGPLPTGLTPLMLAVVDRRPEYVSILLQAGADKTARDDDGLTALDYANARQADEATIRLLR